MYKFTLISALVLAFVACGKPLPKKMKPPVNSDVSKKALEKAQRKQAEATQRIEQATAKINEANQALAKVKAFEDSRVEEAKSHKGYENLQLRLDRLSRATQFSQDSSMALESAGLQLVELQEGRGGDYDKLLLEEQLETLESLQASQQSFDESLLAHRQSLQIEFSEASDFQVDRLRFFANENSQYMLILLGQANEEAATLLRQELKSQLGEALQLEGLYSETIANPSGKILWVKDKFLVQLKPKKIENLRQLVRDKSQGALDLLPVAVSEIQQLTLFTLKEKGALPQSIATTELVKVEGGKLNAEVAQAIYSEDGINCEVMDSNCIKSFLALFKEDSAEKKQWIEYIKSRKDKVVKLSMTRALITPALIKDSSQQQSPLKVYPLSNAGLTKEKYSLFLGHQQYLFLPAPLLEVETGENIAQMIEEVL